MKPNASVLLTAAAGLLAVGIVVTGSPVATAQPFAQDGEFTEYERVVIAQFEQIEIELGAEFKRVGEIHLGSLEQAKSEWVPVPVPQPIKGHYIIVGVCDQDCGDLDLFVYDGDGEAIGRDVEPDAGPVIEVPPGSTATQLRVDMIQCGSEPCIYGLQLYEYLGESGVKSKLGKRRRQ